MAKKKPSACTITSLKKEGEHYILTMKFPKGFKFKAGQFVKLYLDSKLSSFEPFSFFSAPEEKEARFMFKPSSPFKQSLAEKKKGTKLYFEGPYGDFTILTKPSSSVLLCKGLGLIPISSIGKSLIEKRKKLEIYLLYENRDRSEVLNEKRLREFDNHKRVNILMTILNERPMDWPGKVGQISKEMLKSFVPRPRTKDYYICGPSTFVNRMNTILSEMRVPKKRIKSEPWD